jgi:prepilin-type N-terminal cleavage/methylation domain-containing protein
MNRLDARRDDGVTMIEIVVSLTLMAVLMTIFSTAVIDVYRNVNQTEAISSGQSQLNTIFLRLDKDVRYASAISKPQTGGTWYVEYLNTNSGTEICTQLRLTTASGMLQRRTWNRNQNPIQPSGWAVLASNVYQDKGGEPVFDVDKPDPEASGLAGSKFFRLTIKLAAHGRDDIQIAAASITLSALNTSIATIADEICTEGRAVA